MVKHVFAVCMIVIELFLESNCSTNVISSFVHIKWYWKTAWRFNVVSANILILHPNVNWMVDVGAPLFSIGSWNQSQERLSIHNYLPLYADILTYRRVY